MATTSKTPEKLPLPTEGGSYVRQGEDLKRVEHTGPAKDAVATEPAGQPAPAATNKE